MEVGKEPKLSAEFSKPTDASDDSHLVDVSGLRNKNKRWIIHIVLGITALFLWFPWRNLKGFQSRPVISPVNGGCCDGRKRKWYTTPDPDFDWDSIKPSTELKWVPCYGGELDCARLSVPLYYPDPSVGDAAVAMVRVPALVPRDSEEYKGPVLINPGGPGGSGVATVHLLGQMLQTLVGANFDIIGFDPRGVGKTTPTYSPFASWSFDEITWIDRADSSLNLTEQSLSKEFVRAKIIGDLSYHQNVSSYLSTPTVARDMLSIVKAHGMDKLQYWGFSYGTVLGATFAAMFPDNVGRVIIDGVVDSEDYYQTQWAHNFFDTDKTLFKVCEACVKAGPDNCKLYEDTPELVRDRIMTIANSLRTQPAYFYNPMFKEYGLVDSGDVQKAIFTVLYNAHTLGRRLTDALAALEKGDAYPIWLLTIRPIVKNFLVCRCPSVPTVFGVATTNAILCSDGEAVEDDIDDLREYYARLANASELGAPLWPLRVGCSGWRTPAKEQYRGNFTANTSYPMLIIGNTADPVTPLWAAHKMSKGFNNSVVLTQDSAGHCSISAVSLCTMKYVNAYFQNGTLPEPGTVCNDVASGIFQYGLSLNEMELPEEERDFVGAADYLRLNYFVPRLGDSIHHSIRPLM